MALPSMLYHPKHHCCAADCLKCIGHRFSEEAGLTWSARARGGFKGRATPGSWGEEGVVGRQGIDISA